MDIAVATRPVALDDEIRLPPALAAALARHRLPALPLAR